VAVARALVNRPTLLLCDEPTGSLDSKTAAAVSELLLELHQSEGAKLIVVTHSGDLAARFERRYTLEEGRCVAA
jgi:ABC-type lipoprotein export system ATPase subunit